ncbi:MAG: hypothetical protein ACLUNO_07370 [Oscillospiraceae bacterium]
MLAVLMTLTLIAPQALAANTVDPVKPAGNKIVVSQTDYTLVDGVTESDVFLNTKEGNAQIAGFMTTIAPGAKATFKASYNGYYTEGSTPASRKDKAANLAWSMEKNHAAGCQLRQGHRRQRHHGHERRLLQHADAAAARLPHHGGQPHSEE